MGWLDKYKDGGEINYNNSFVSLPKGFVGEGYNTKGRNYSPAWNGQFSQGGQLQKLDDLLNFTNYNKPQSTKWLDKYK